MDTEQRRAKEALKGRRGPLTEDDRQLRDAERKIGELTMEVEVWRRAAELSAGAREPAFPGGRGAR